MSLKIISYGNRGLSVLDSVLGISALEARLTQLSGELEPLSCVQILVLATLIPWSEYN